jgi:uncharacterized membrane protein HdeD (DUF308 family)
MKNVFENIEEIQTKEQANARIKELKKQIRTLEIAVIAIGLIGLSLIVLPLLGILSFNILSVLAIIGGIILIVKAFKDGEILETEKFFLLLIFSNNKKEEDGK